MSISHISSYSQKDAENLKFMVSELNQRLSHQEQKHVKGNAPMNGIDGGTVYQMRKSFENLLKRVGDLTCKIDNVKHDENHLVNERDNALLIVNRLRTQLRQNEDELHEARQQVHRMKDIVNKETQSGKRSDTYREQLAVTVSNSLCSGYIHLVISGHDFATPRERRFICLTLSDIKIFDITLSKVSHQILLKDCLVETSENKSDVSYDFQDRSSQQIFQFIITKTTNMSSKWVRVFNEEVLRHQGARMEIGPTMFHSFPEPIKELFSESVHSNKEDLDDNSTIVGFDVLETKLRSGRIHVTSPSYSTKLLHQEVSVSEPEHVDIPDEF